MTPIRNQAQAQDPYSPVQQVVTMEERQSDSFAPRRFRMLLFGAFAALAPIAVPALRKLTVY